MRWVLYTVVGLVLVVGLTCVVGWFLPQSHVASASARLNLTPEQAYDLLSNTSDYAKWWKGYDPVPVTMEDAVRPSRFVTRIKPGLPFGGTWTYEIVPDGAGSRVTVTERGEVYNLFFRFVSRVFMSPTATMEKMLRAASAIPRPGQ